MLSCASLHGFAPCDLTAKALSCRTVFWQLLLEFTADKHKHVVQTGGPNFSKVVRK